MRNKALYDVLLSQASAGSLAGKVNVVDQDDVDVDEDAETLSFECLQCMTEMTISFADAMGSDQEQQQEVVEYLTQCDSCSLYY